MSAALALDALTYTTGGATLLDGVDLTVAPGETVALVGPNGSGKTTLLRCVYGALTPTGGRVRLDGTDLAGLSARQRALRIAAVPQDGHSGQEFTAAQIVAMGRSPHKRFWEADTAADVARAAGALDRVGAGHLAAEPFGRLSGGERQRVLLARTLVQEPALLVLDEPTNHLDIRYQLEVLALVRSLRTSSLLALHDLNLAAHYCDRLHVLAGGRTVAEGPPAEVLTAELLAAVYGVRAEVSVHPRTGSPTVTYLPGPV
ncbi:Iron-chelate-transporting ATPase [Streptomyces albus]|uniref:Iron-chelate-transporting ATPase n=1 Tax=Streptomyces albus (strain ATCC 21838 / DSM 41398 / FERM P-419 / JCM 4703 / NBRC 107858) TaxID=1081613 RepID=A0A0B5EMT0_STRA4|nr:Iron-chelate-transporting ATPase [Streptomyces albus]AOU77141.1 Iron-chelate-transporting ATPase [Streptomyces albus]AYN32919.1 ABC transporter ATP-binding protein [Streptomyces albus]